MIPFYKPPVGEEEAQAVFDVVKSGWLTYGSKTEQFEQEFAKYINAPYCVMTNSCTWALFLAVAWWKQQQFGNEMIGDIYYPISIPSLTCAATALAVIHNRLPVKFDDLRYRPIDSFVMRTTDSPSIPVHFAGKHCRQLNVVVEDCAHRIVRNGFSGNLQAYSFYVTKNLTTGEGGMIACATKEQAEWFKQARLYGIDKNVREREKMFSEGKRSWYFQCLFPGWKCNPTDINATIGLVQLQKLDIMNESRRQVAQKYNQLIGCTMDREAWHLYPILIKKRDDFIEYMKSKDIHCSVHFPPLHQMPAFKSGDKLPITDWVFQHIVSLPFYPYMEDGDIETVAKEVNGWHNKYGQPTLYKEQYEN